MLRDAKERYDCVIMDTPPVLGLPDVKACRPRGCDLVRRAVGPTRRDAVAAALKQLADVSAEVSGVVLNQVDMKKHASYAYGDAGNTISVQQMLRQMIISQHTLKAPSDQRPS